jgi:hypothetical protein
LSFLSCIDLIGHPLLCVRFNERYRMVIGEKWPKFFWLFGAYREDRRVGVAPAQKAVQRTQKPSLQGAMGPPSSAPFSISVPSTFTNNEFQFHNYELKSSSSGQGKRQGSTRSDMVKKLSKFDNVSGKKTIIDFHLQPEDNDTILNKMWTKYAPQN